MTPAEAQRLPGLACEADLVGPDVAGWVQRLAPHAHGCGRRRGSWSSRFLVEHDQERAAAELAAGVLGVVAAVG
jgi:hypothetical protein